MYRLKARCPDATQPEDIIQQNLENQLALIALTTNQIIPSMINYSKFKIATQKASLSSDNLSKAY